MVEVTQGNLFGKGQFIKLRGELGSKTTYYDLTFQGPMVFGHACFINR